MAKTDFELEYQLLTEGHLDLMYLPSGAIAWLFDRPETQVQAASQLGVEAHRFGNNIVEANLLRSDQNVLILHTKQGQRIMVYPDGGYGMDGQPYGLQEISAILGGGQEMLQVEFASDIPVDSENAGIPSMNDLAFDLPAEDGLGFRDLV